MCGCWCGVYARVCSVCRILGTPIHYSDLFCMLVFRILTVCRYLNNITSCTILCFKYE